VDVSGTYIYESKRNFPARTAFVYVRAGNGKKIMMGRIRNILLTAALLVPAVLAQQNVLTGGYDNYRTNANQSETILTSTKVNSNNFGRLFSLSVDGQIFAQPLYQQNVAIAGHGTHNVLFTATMHNTVYAFDADTPATPLWSVNLGPSVPTSNYQSDTGVYTDITPENGILSTPVIDPSTGTLYCVAATYENSSYIYRLHALDTSSGAERFGGPAAIQMRTPGLGIDSVNGTVVFDGSQHIQRPALLLSNGYIYIAFGSHGDASPYHGWVVAYSAQNVTNQVAVMNSSPNGNEGAVWQSGRGLTADESGNVYAVSSNGDSDFTANFSNSVLKLDPGTLAVSDWFAPFNYQLLSDNDEDLGSAGAMLIPGTNYLVTGGKAGALYLMDRTRLGHSAPNDSQILQTVQMGDFGIFNMALWNRPDGLIVYAHIANRPVTAWKMSGGLFGTTPMAQSLKGFVIPFQGMTLSANGGQAGTGILWVTGADVWPLPGPGVLHAYNAETMEEVWNSSINDADTLGGFVKFVNPTVANGKVYVPTMDYQLIVYGPKVSALTIPSVTGIVNSASYTGAAVAPGEIVAIFGQSIGPQSVTVGSFENAGNPNTELYGTQVTFNGVPAPLIYTSSGSAAAIVPFEIAGTTQADVVVSYNGRAATTQTVNLTDAAPGIFTADASGSGPGAILNADYTLNSSGNPAAAGSIAVIYATGGGQTNPGSTSGTVTTQATPLAAGVSATIGGQAAKVLYAGNAGGEVAGVVQINLRIPSGISGTLPVVVTIAGHASQSTVTIAIQ
jgi:uncharacterized protein (TIGR03437 family)